MKILGMIEIVWAFFLTAVYLFCVAALAFFVFIFDIE